MADFGESHDRTHRSRWPRAWLDFERYQEVHDRYMEILYREAVLERDTLRFAIVRDRQSNPLQVTLQGLVVCVNGAHLRVLKWMDIRHPGAGRFDVLTTYYQYHA
jgi:hypothetical protein